MPRLLVHMGLHKTATTAFQKACVAHREALLTAGISYPPMGRTGHHGLVSDLRAERRERVAAILGAAAAEVPADGVVLLSSEDFECFFLEPELATTLTDIAMQAGISQSEWHVVLRDPFSYFESLYAELVLHAASTRYDLMAEAILYAGSYTVQVPQMTYHFIFDYDRFTASFERNVEAPVRAMPFEDFTSGFPGRVLLCEAGATDDVLAAFESHFAEKPRSNVRRQDFRVELAYAARFAGHAASGARRSGLIRALAAVSGFSGAAARFLLRRQVRPAFQRRFEERFSSPAPREAAQASGAAAHAQPQAAITSR